MPGDAEGKSQAVQGSHLARKVEKSEAKFLALEPLDSIVHWRRGGCEWDMHSSPTPAGFALGGPKYIKKKMHKYAL